MGIPIVHFPGSSILELYFYLAKYSLSLVLYSASLIGNAVLELLVKTRLEDLERKYLTLFFSII